MYNRRMASGLPVHVRLLQRRVIADLLADRGLSQQELSRQLDVEPNMVSRWMTGRVVMTCYWAQRVGTVLHLTDPERLCLVAAAARLDYERMLCRPALSRTEPYGDVAPRPPARGGRQPLPPENQNDVE